MAMQTTKRSAGFLAVCTILAALLIGMYAWQVIGADVSNPRANFWRTVRHGIAGYSSTPAQGHTVLIQNGGENWREIRNALLMPYAQWVLAGALAAMGLFYLLIGGDKLEKPRTGVRIERYVLGERVLHWYTAVLFIIMAITGLNLLLGRVALIPIFGHPAFSGYSQVTKVLHNYGGPLLLVGIFLEFVIWLRHNIPRKMDLAWYKNMGGMLGKGPRPHAGKINGGQKAWFWLVVIFGLFVGVTGTLLDFPIWGQSRFTLQVSHVIHVIVAVLFVAASFGHMYMGSVGAEGALEGMWTGSVDEVWARQHADLWYEEMKRRQGETPKTGEP